MIIKLLKFYIIFTCILTTLNVKTKNDKVVDLIESYKFDVKSIFIWQHTKKDINFLMRQALGHDYYGPEILYIFFEHLNVLKWKKTQK
jgi:hypothetical protein